jgi:hypothetical protein
VRRAVNGEPLGSWHLREGVEVEMERKEERLQREREA